MKIKFHADILIYLIIIGVASLIVVNALNNFNSDKKHSTTYNSWQGNIKPIDEYIPDTLTHREYKKIQDSLNVTSSLKNGDAFLSGGLKFFDVGIVTGMSCDTCSIRWLNERGFKDRTHEQYYIELDAWTVNQRNELEYVDEGKFYVKNKQGYLRKPIITYTENRKDGSVYNKINIVDVQVKFRFDHRSKSILIPVNHSTAQGVSKILVVMVVITLAYAIFLLLAFLRLIIDLSSGVSFTKRNVICLKILAVGLIIYPIIVLLPSYIVKWVYADYFTIDIILKNDISKQSGFVFAGGILFLLLSNAFRKGKMLKEEQDLTV